MSRILIVTERFWPEDFIINDLAVEWSRQGDTVTVLTQQPSYPKSVLFDGYKNRFFSREVWQDIAIIRFRTILGYRNSLFWKLANYFWFSTFGSFMALLGLPDFDKILIYQTGPLTMAIPGILVGRIRNRPITLWTQDVWPESVYAYGFRKGPILSFGLDKFVSWVYRSVDNNLISCLGFEEILQRYFKGPFKWAPNWPMAHYTNNSLPRNYNSLPTFLFAGNIGKVQNLHNILKGFALALRQEPTLGRLRIVGDGSALESLKLLAEQEEIHVDFPGRKPAYQMDEEYNDADFLVLSLADEPVFRLTVPAKFQMYLSVGKPILCAAAGEVARQVRDNGVGLVVDPNDPNSIADGFLTMRKTNPEEIQAWNRNASELLHRHYNRDAILRLIRGVVTGDGN